MEEYQQLLNNISQIIMKYDEIDRINGSKFNIFQILNVAEDELKHSLFIAELLNPKGRHGLGSQFLKLFLEKVGIDYFDTESSSVETEKYIGPVSETTGGFIDIFLYDKKGNNIVIENKIYAGDQSHQLIRYHKFAPDNVLYLTLNGGSPSSDSISYNNIHLKKDENFRVISYQSHIIEWLESCKKVSFEYPLLREGLTHYINLIKYLTGQSTNKNMEEEILKLAFENKKNLEMIAVFGNRFEEIKNKYHMRFWEALLSVLESKKLKIDEKHKNRIDTKSLSSLKVNNGFWILIESIQEYDIYYSIFFDDCVYCGITIEMNEEFIGTKSNIYLELAAILLNTNISFQPSKYRLGDKKITPNINFLDFKPENIEIFNLFKVDDLNSRVYRIVDEVDKDIKEFKKNIKKQ